jgi:hypothetical protein
MPEYPLPLLNVKIIKITAAAITKTGIQINNIAFLLITFPPNIYCVNSVYQKPK